MRSRLFSMAVVFGAVIASGVALPAEAQTNRLLGRWVGTHLGRPLFFDFYSDTLLVVNDRHALDFWSGRDSLIAYGDTSFAIQYWFSLDKLLIRNIEGNTVTMSPQTIEARPVFSGTGSAFANWIANLYDGSRIQLQIQRIGSRARWRRLPNGEWHEGEWTRISRNYTFKWPVGAADTTTWEGQFDTQAHQFIFAETEPGSGVVIFRRTFQP